MQEKEYSYLKIEQNNSTIDQSLPLDSNHSHFILYDDGTQNILNKNYDFRTKFENQLRKGFNLEDKTNGIQKEKNPMVLIVVQGGFGTLKAVSDALDNQIPVLLIAVCSYAYIFFVNEFMNNLNYRKLVELLI